MEEPSNPMPPSRASGSSSDVMAKLFKIPRISVNHNLMNFIFCSFATLRTYSFASLALGILASPFQKFYGYFTILLLQEYYKIKIFLKLDIPAHGVITFDRSQGRGGSLCQGLIPYQSLRIQVANPRAISLGHPQSQYP